MIQSFFALCAHWETASALGVNDQDANIPGASIFLATD